MFCAKEIRKKLEKKYWNKRAFFLGFLLYFLLCIFFSENGTRNVQGNLSFVRKKV